MRVESVPQDTHTRTHTAPLLMLVPPKHTHVHGVCFTLMCALQVVIAATGHYGFFNLLACVVGRHTHARMHTRAHTRTQMHTRTHAHTYALPPDITASSTCWRVWWVHTHTRVCPCAFVWYMAAHTHALVDPVRVCACACRRVSLCACVRVCVYVCVCVSVGLHLGAP